MNHRNVIAALALFGVLGACVPDGTQAHGDFPYSAGKMTAQLTQTEVALAHQAVTGKSVGGTLATLTGTGYAAISAQPGHSLTEKRLMAIKAGRVEALADLAAQIDGMQISAHATVQDAIVRDSKVEAQVMGVLRGAKTVKILPKGRDAYQVEVAVDRDVVGYMLRNLANRGL